MFNDINRADITDIFKNLIASDPRLQEHKSDLGIIALSNEMGYKIDDAIKRISSKFTEFYEPTTEAVLLSILMYQIGYIRFQKPLVISSKITSVGNVSLEKNQRFTSGVDVFLLNEAITLDANVEQTITLTMGTTRTITATVDNNNFYYKIPLKSSYQKLYDFEVYRGIEQLKYSQAFISEDSDVSLEVDLLGNLSVVLRVGNTNGSNISLNDVLRVEVFETSASDDIPQALSVIGDTDLLCTEVQKSQVFEPPLNIIQMQDIVKYNKNINNSIVYNENYENLIKAQIRGIQLLKVWQQEDEDKENGIDGCNINKIFCSYLPLIVGTDLDAEIVELVSSTVYGKHIEIRTPNILQVIVNINVINNTKKSISIVLQNEIKAKISGYYDNKDRRLTKAIVYRDIVETLQGHNIDVDFTMINADSALNADFFNIDTSNVNITVTERV
ncbi:MAG: hypothetical protein GQ474_09570 [Sulfurimonas sp.]|nr:hypothetical protein [Sulfurimonas sp.]